MTERVLCVDDDANVLASYQRQLRKQFEIEIAEGPEAGLEAFTKNGPFAVVLADLNMPGMNGIEFLKKVKEKDPETVRIMLTGNADLRTAIEAVNTGNIFRFLTKPCETDVLSATLQAGIEQYFLVTAEKGLLKNTLASSIRVMTEILGMVNRTAFSRSERIRKYVTGIAKAMNITDVWQYEVAAMLSQIGCLMLPARLVEKVNCMERLTENEETLFITHPSVAYKLLSKIPRMGAISQMIEGQLRPFNAYTKESKLPMNAKASLGAQLLKVALDLDQLLESGRSPVDAVNILMLRPEIYNPDIVAGARKMFASDITKKEEVVLEIGVRDVKIGMIADQDIVANDGTLLVPRNQVISHPLWLLLRNYERGNGVPDTIRVRICKESAENQRDPEPAL